MFLETKRDGETTPDLGTLRVDRILALADEIERPTLGLGFNMNYWMRETYRIFVRHSLRIPQNSCGTVCCIGGHTQVMFGDKDAGDLLGLSRNVAYNLFYPSGIYNWDQMPPVSSVISPPPER